MHTLAGARGAVCTLTHISVGRHEPIVGAEICRGSMSPTYCSAQMLAASEAMMASGLFDDHKYGAINDRIRIDTNLIAKPGNYRPRVITECWLLKR